MRARARRLYLAMRTNPVTVFMLALGLALGFTIWRGETTREILTRPSPCEVNPDGKECQEPLRKAVRAVRGQGACIQLRRARPYVVIDSTRRSVRCPNRDARGRSEQRERSSEASRGAGAGASTSAGASARGVQAPNAPTSISPSSTDAPPDASGPSGGGGGNGGGSGGQPGGDRPGGPDPPPPPEEPDDTLLGPVLDEACSITRPLALC